MTFKQLLIIQSSLCIVAFLVAMKKWDVDIMVAIGSAQMFVIILWIWDVVASIVINKRDKKWDRYNEALDKDLANIEEAGTVHKLIKRISRKSNNGHICIHCLSDRECKICREELEVKLDEAKQNIREYYRKGENNIKWWQFWNPKGVGIFGLNSLIRGIRDYIQGRGRE